MFDMFELSPLWRSVLVLLLLLSLLFCSLRVCMLRVASGTPVLYVYIFSSHLLLRLMVSRRVPRAISP